VLSLPPQSAGKKFRCPGCKSIFVAGDKGPNQGVQPAARAPLPNPPPPPSPFENLPEEEGAIASTPIPQRPPAPSPIEDEDTDVRLTNRRPSGASRPLRFGLRVKADPDKLLRGAFAAEATPEGCRLRQGKKHEFLLPPGTFAEYHNGTRIAVEIDGRVVEFQVVKLGSYQKRLARDVVAFLGGQRPALRAKDYSLEWYLLVPVLLPLAIPILTLGGALPAVIGIGAAAIGYGIAQVEDWPVAVRALCCWSAAVSGYLVFGLFILVLVLLQMQRAAPPAPGPVPVVPRAVPPVINPPRPAH